MVVVAVTENVSFEIAFVCLFLLPKFCVIFGYFIAFLEHKL